MCYLVAKDRDVHGCFALKTTQIAVILLQSTTRLRYFC